MQSKCYQMFITRQLPDVYYKAATTHKHIKQKVPNDGDTPKVYLR